MLRLSPIPDRRPVRHVIQVPPELDAELRAYAETYAEVYGETKPLAELIPAILTTFIAGDRAFTRLKRSRVTQPRRAQDG